VTSVRARALCGTALAVVVAAMSASAALGMSVLPLDLARLTADAGTIFVGRVEHVEAGRDERGIPAVWTTFAVTDSLKGGAGARLTLKQLGGGITDPSGGSASAPAIGAHAGLPRYAVGESVVLFVHPESTLGFTSPVGLGQGCFRIREQDGARVVENDVGNRNLAPTGPSGGRAAAPAVGAAAPVALDAFLDRVRALVAD
jgi:hypothetical protein